MTSKNLSNYLNSLDNVSSQRYKDKIKLINDTDPYKIEKSEWIRDIQKWAGVEYPDIVNFLLYTTSAYTLDELKSYKGLEAYNQFVCGWVRDVAVCIINGRHVHTCRVLHSQRMSETALMPWIIVQPDGKVLAAHCNCMAGLGESCTHIAALLFSLEATVKIRNSRTVTEEKAYWLPASVKGVTYSRIEDIDFTSAKSKKRVLDCKLSGTPVPRRGQIMPKQVAPPTTEELSNFLLKLSLTGAQSAVLSVTTPYNDSFVPQVLNPKYPSILTDLANEDLFDADYSAVIHYCKDVNISVSSEESVSVESATKLQSRSKLWHRFRSGRITASKIYSACHSNHMSPSQSLVMSICHPESTVFKSAATSWGCEHEKTARSLYEESMSLTHDNFVVEDVGFTINPAYPIFGATPDGMVSCDCCGYGLLEIKCPYCVRFSNLKDYTGSKACLEETDEGTKRLKTGHPYYYQVQTQMIVCEKDYCDFVVWTEKEVHIERVELDHPFWTDIAEKASNFHSMAVMPELVAKFYSRKDQPLPLKPVTIDNNTPSDEDLFCICQEPETPEKAMVACDNENCKYQWFHLQCLKLTKSKLPKGKWYCPDCSKLTNCQKKKRIRKK